MCAKRINNKIKLMKVNVFVWLIKDILKLIMNVTPVKIYVGLA